jgi:hypothetical protein
MSFIAAGGLYYRLPATTDQPEENEMTGHMTQDANRMHAEPPIAIRRATEADRDTLERLAALDSARTPSGEILIAERGDEPQAAIEVTSGVAVADPFRPTAHVVELLRRRADRLTERASSSRRLGLRWRSAYRAA